MTTVMPFAKRIETRTTTAATTTTTRLGSTPFEADLYDDGDNPFMSSYSPRDRRRRRSDPDHTTSRRLVIGLCKYSHDAAICAADARTGQVLFASAKERLSRKKHDAGNTATLVETCLTALDLDLSNIDVVVMNNHHYRILPSTSSPSSSSSIESSLPQMEWEAGLCMNGGHEDGYLDDENLLPNVPIKMELSHHLAHAYSAATQAPFDHGLVCILDGMGETYKTMQQGLSDEHYVSDYDLLPAATEFRTIPHNLAELAQTSLYDWREAESVYVFSKKKIYPNKNNNNKENNNNNDNNSNNDDDNDDSNLMLEIRPIFKRFTPEHTPPVLYNHGFENMDSLGALYSRVSSHIFGDWNACGKVMGLAPWAVVTTKGGGGGNGWDDGKMYPPVHDCPIVSGQLYYNQDNGAEHGQQLKINRTLIQGMPLVARQDPELFMTVGRGSEDIDLDMDVAGPRKRYDFDPPQPVPDYTGNGQVTYPETSSNEPLQPPTQIALEAIALSARMQTDLETVVMDFVRHFKEQTGQSNLVLAGGVALNSVLNGRLWRELGFEQTFIPPYPGDDGIAVGCCAYGLFGDAIKTSRLKNKKRSSLDPAASTSTTTIPRPQQPTNRQQQEQQQQRPTLWKGPLSPYLGAIPLQADIRMALDQAAPWIQVDVVRNKAQRYERMVQEIASGGVIAWYHGRSEMGPRALGHRSILADPRKHGLVRFLNRHVKSRESFRPFAPSVLAEHVHDWFELDGFSSGSGSGSSSSGKHPSVRDNNISPYMSLTAPVKEHQRFKIPAVTHVDGSSRLQTVTRQAEPDFHALITAFYRATGIPMVLNTSFNTIPGEPIVETPAQAIRSFLYTTGNIELLVLEDYVITRKSADLRRLLGEIQGRQLAVEPACPQRAGAVSYQASFVMPKGPTRPPDKIVTTTKVQMPDRILHVDGQWTELVDELEAELLSACDGTMTLNEILVHYTSVPASADKDGGSKKSSPSTAATANYDEIHQLIQNIVHRLARLYDQTFIHW